MFREIQTMKKYLSILPVLLFWIAVQGQDKNFVVLGKVIDSASGLPLAGASAYCQNTTYGTTSNNEGLFFMRLPNGGYDLVITYTGYEKRIMRLSNNNATNTDTLNIVLAKEDKTMTEVAVVATNEVANGWEKYGKFFTEHFIGTTPNAAHCTLENPQNLHFFYSKKRNRLKVTADSDLVVKNYALGYIVRYQLDSFSYDYTSQISQFTGSPFFIEMDTVETVKTQWGKNRGRTYLGSRLHFMRALYDSTVTEEGFILEKLDSDSAGIKSVFITDIYNENDYVADSTDVIMNWAGQYRISYKPVLPDRSFLTEFKLPLNTRFQITVVDVADGFIIEENGYFYEQYEVINTGYWAWKKLAELLPYDYQYE